MSYMDKSLQHAIPQYANGLSYSTLTVLNVNKSPADVPCDVCFTISKSDMNVTDICHKKKMGTLYPGTLCPMLPQLRTFCPWTLCPGIFLPGFR